jgi:hypothetical protein
MTTTNNQPAGTIVLPRTNKETVFFLQDRIKATTARLSFKIKLQLKTNLRWIDIVMSTEIIDGPNSFLLRAIDDRDRNFYLLVPVDAYGYYKLEAWYSFSGVFTMIQQTQKLSHLKVLSCEPIVKIPTT